MYAGVEPAALFESRDAADDVGIVRGLYEHPHRKQWHPGGGGLTAAHDRPAPDRRTEDVGRDFDRRGLSDRGRRPDLAAAEPGRVGEVHARPAAGVRAVRPPRVADPTDPSRLFLQNHWGLFRSDDWAETWAGRGRDLPVDVRVRDGGAPAEGQHGVHPAAGVGHVPLHARGKAARLADDRRRRAWQPLTNGLPQHDALETVLRHGMDVDPLAPAGVYFGTESGKVYASADEGESWRMIKEGLPPVLCVKAYAV